MRNLTILLLLALIATCGACGRSRPRTIYETACDAVRAHTNFPASAVIHPQDEAAIQVCKNAARVDLHYHFTAESGETVRGSFTVWLRDMAHSWEIDRCLPAPQYAPEPATNAAPAETVVPGPATPEPQPQPEPPPAND